jgi:hypothetical protein
MLEKRGGQGACGLPDVECKPLRTVNISQGHITMSGLGATEQGRVTGTICTPEGTPGACLAAVTPLLH